MKNLKITVLLISLVLTSLTYFIFPKIVIADNSCSVTSARWEPSGEQEDGWYVEDKTKASIILETSGCVGQSITLDIKEADTCGVANCDDSLPDSGLEDYEFLVKKDKIIFPYIVGEEACEGGLGIDCDYYFRVENQNIPLYSSWKKTGGNLKYECDTVCFKNWKLQEILYTDINSGSNSSIVSTGSNNSYSISPTGNRILDENYDLLQPIGVGDKVLDKIDGKTTLNDYLNIFFKILIGLCGALAVIMIVIHGITLMGDESVFGRTEAKSRIRAAILGLLLALGAYALLNTINPDLVGGSVNVRKVTITLTSGQQYRLYQTQASTKTFLRTKYYEKIKTVSSKSEYNIPHCLLQVAIQRESGGIDGLVGHDEEAPLLGIPSRKSFVNSGKKYSGSTFTPNQSLITDTSFHNDDHSGSNLFSASNRNASDLGLDWRYSHAVGLFGVTFFPKGSSYGDYTKGIYMPKLKRNIFPKDLFNPDTDILVAAEMMSNTYKKCGNNIENTYRSYGSGSCTGSNPFTNIEAPLRKNLYDQCVAQDK